MSYCPNCGCYIVGKNEQLPLPQEVQTAIHAKLKTLPVGSWIADGLVVSSPRAFYTELREAFEDIARIVLKERK